MFSDIGEQVSLRQFDISNRRRDRLMALVQVVPIAPLGFSASAGIGQEHRPGAAFGLQDNDLRTFSVGVDATRTDALVLGTEYSFEHYGTLQHSRQANPGPQFDDPTRQIVGIVGDVRENGLDNPAPEVFYVPLGQVPEGLTQLGNGVLPRSWLIRTSVDPRTLVQAFKKEFLALDNQLAIAKVRTMEQVIVEATARQSFNMLLFTIFACVALLLASIGIYGVMSYAVEQRTHEIGIRMALGARTGDMMRLVVGNGMKLVAVGLVAGLAGAFWLTRYMSAMLYGVKPSDPLTYVEVALVLLAVAFLATYIPARRAAQVDPVIALRYE